MWWGSGFALVKLAVSFLLHSLSVFHCVFVGFPIVVPFLSSVCNLFFAHSFLQYSHIFVFLISFHHLFSFNNAFMCNLHNPISVFMLLLKRNFPLVPHYLSSDVCLRLFVLFSFLFAHSFSKQEQSYSGENWVWHLCANLKSKQLWKNLHSVATRQLGQEIWEN